MLTVALSFLIILLVLVLSHEFGHFLFAKLSGVKVEEFAFGFPPRLFAYKGRETEYSFNLIPLGGFVKIKGEEGEDMSDPNSFAAKPFFTKILILLAGVVFNLALAYLLISLGFMLGTPVPLGENDQNPAAQVRITAIQARSPADQIGIKPGDRLVAIRAGMERTLVNKIGEAQKFINERRGKEIALEIERGGKTLTLIGTPRIEVKEGEGALGIQMTRLGLERLSVLKALAKGFWTTKDVTILTARALANFLGEIILGRASFESVSGPVGIVSLVSDLSHFGAVFLIQLTAFLSINLALINLIPFPGLDGGRAFLLLVEKLRGRPISFKTSKIIHATGFAALILLMIIVTYHDLVKLGS